jgi:hypothetical protein
MVGLAVVETGLWMASVGLDGLQYKNGGVRVDHIVLSAGMVLVWVSWATSASFRFAADNTIAIPFCFTAAKTTKYSTMVDRPYISRTMDDIPHDSWPSGLYSNFNRNIPHLG